ncbi:MAG: bifunctional nuclease family protein [Deltaproteobacteria bacterium]|nr:bifunctional nuclease family protein [Deltaproteobacteria bacterium]
MSEPGGPTGSGAMRVAGAAGEGDGAVLIPMKVARLTVDPCNGLPLVLLEGLEGGHLLPIWVGLAEASAIAVPLEGVQFARPMTHDLMYSLLSACGAEVVHIVVTEVRDQTFYARIILQQGEQRSEVDARPSDALALALRTGCAIFVNERVLSATARPTVTAAHASADPALASEDPPRAADWLESLPDEEFGKWKM